MWPVACRRVRSAVHRRRRRGQKPATRQAPQHVAHLLSIAVARQYQGTGVAHDLAEAFADDVKRRGYEKYLASVREDNVHSQNFFASLGARRQYAKEGIVCLTIDLGSPTGFPVRE
jgi:ribosomal protein S18 acetylase RimI-like enzyme